MTALAFLTRLPVPGPPRDGTDVGRATMLFPVAGALIGAAQVFVLWILASLSVPAPLAAVLSVAFLFLLVGGLHQDGLADMVDGFGGGRRREDVLRIMRDSRVGAFGAMALVLTVLTRTLALTYLADAENGWRWVIVAAAVSRCSPVIGCFLPSARRAESGASNAVMDGVGPAEVLGAVTLAGALSIAFVGVPFAVIALLVSGAVFAHNGLLCRRRIGGFTGDTLGAAAETADVLVLVLGARLVTA